MVVQLEWLTDPGWPYLRQMPDEALKEQAARKFDNKTHTWIPDPDEGFLIVEVMVAEGQTFSVKLPNGQTRKITKDQCQEINPSKFEKTEDMANLTFLNEASVLHNLRQRYKSMMIYTYSGLFCVFINPYKMLPIYTDSVIEMYNNQRRSEMPPHLFAVSDEAYRNMVTDKKNQSMLITGESGAGKTENTKKVISYFAKIGGSNESKVNPLKKAVSFSDFPVGGSLEDKVVQANPAIEAFGNGKTNRNNNSSRYGKFIRIHFDKSGKLVGGDIESYLLEKSRVIKQGPGERSFHIFYQIMTNKKLRKEYLLSNNIKDYHFVSQAEITVPGMNDTEEMSITDNAFNVMGFTGPEKNDLYKLCGAIMHMGEMKFKQKPREEQAEVDSMNAIDNVCKLFSINGEKFVQALLKPQVKVGTEWVCRGQNLQQVEWSVQALAKAIYSRMFKWLIDRCNETLSTNLDESVNYIGVLDIAGFEIFDTNSFEQLWINFVNEKLQQFFNHHMFILEQEEYQREGIVWEFIDFGLDLQNCIDLIEKPLGIISMLDEECIVPKATDMTYAEKLKNQHLGKHTNFQTAKPPRGKQGEAHFAIVHYAGTVRYNVIGWLEKNKDPLNDSAVAVLKTSDKKNLIYKIFEDYQTETDREEAHTRGKELARKKGKSASFMTVSNIYKESLNNLMSMLHTTHPHFIRCIIPNEVKMSGEIDAQLVLNQLTCNGVLEGIRICRKGFPNRMVFSDFRYRYAILAADESRLPDIRDACIKMMDKLLKSKKISEDEFRVGETKVFFKAGILAKMEEYRDAALSNIILKFQCQARFYLAQIELKERERKINAIIDLQRNIRTWIKIGNWSWYKLYIRLKPLMGGFKTKEEMEALEKKIKEMEEMLAAANEENQKIKAIQNESVKREEELKTNIKNEQKEKEMFDKKLKEYEEALEKEKQINIEREKKNLERESRMENERKRLEEEIFRQKQEMETMTMKHTIQIEELAQKLLLQGDISEQMNQQRKIQEQAKLDLMDQLERMGSKVERIEKQRLATLEELSKYEEKVNYEKKLKEEQIKLRKKLENEMKQLIDKIELLENKNDALEKELRDKHEESIRLKDKNFSEISLISKMQVNIRQLIERIGQIEDELDIETRARSRAEKSKAELQRELDEALQTITELTGQLNAQMHINKNKQHELAGLQREMDKRHIGFETHLSDLCSMQMSTLNNLRRLSTQAKCLEHETNLVLECRKPCEIKRSYSLTSYDDDKE
uniref:Myosin motor domain-containing protein n=1 Tax=Strongyloides papillosus TaxID=174720 RepID=A0A0N5BM88_STREA